jgi:hypothetical protein
MSLHSILEASNPESDLFTNPIHQAWLTHRKLQRSGSQLEVELVEAALYVAVGSDRFYDTVEELIRTAIDSLVVVFLEQVRNELLMRCTTHGFYTQNTHLLTLAHYRNSLLALPSHTSSSRLRLAAAATTASAFARAALAAAR